MKTRFARSIWSKSLAGLCLSLLLGCGQATNQDVSDQYAARGLHHIDNADPVLAWSAVLDSQEIQRAKDISHLQFEPRAAEVRSGQVIVSGELINPTNAPTVVYISGLPFTLMPRTGNGISWRQDCQDPCCMPEIPAPPLNNRFTLPPRSTVTFSKAFDLCRLQYSGTPEIQLDWRLNLLTRPPETGAATVRLPKAP